MDNKELEKKIVPIAEEGVILLEKGDYEKAVKKFEEVLEIEAKLPYVKVNLGICYMNLKK